MSTSPTREERAKKDAELKAKEAAEQAQLPYKWTQTIQDVDITVPVPANIKGKDLDVVMTKSKLKVGIKGQTPIIDVRFPSPPLVPVPSHPVVQPFLGIRTYLPPRTYLGRTRGGRHPRN